MNTLASTIRTNRPASLQHLDRTHRGPRLLALMTRAAHAKWLHAHAVRVRWRLYRATQIALRDLDSRTLHDLGLDRSEISSIAAEVAHIHAELGSAFSDDDGEYRSHLRGFIPIPRRAGALAEGRPVRAANVSEPSGLPRPRKA
jgi:uncharacterized protein YjiS (DUF1127 family)